MCVDMGQADRSLYRTARSADNRMSWLFAIRKAHERMGYASILDVPEGKVADMQKLARSFRETLPV